MWLRFNGDVAVSHNGPLLLLLLLLLLTFTMLLLLMLPWPLLGRSAAREFMNSSEAIRSSCVDDLNRFLGRTATDGPVMTIGECWIDLERIRSVVALPKI